MQMTPATCWWFVFAVLLGVTFSGPAGPRLSTQPSDVTNSQEMVAWARAVRQWSNDSPRDAGTQLARGVLLECLALPTSRMGMAWSLLSKEDADACGTPATPRGEDLRAGRVQTLYWTPPLAMLGCRSAAKRAYQRAVERDERLVEARLRLAYLTIVQPRTSPSHDDDPGLLRLLKENLNRQYRFLATLFLGLGAERRNDFPLAASRYEEARAIAPEWKSARYVLFLLGSFGSSSVWALLGRWELRRWDLTW